MIAKDCPAPVPFGENIGSIVFLTTLFFLSFISRFIFAPLMPTIQQDLSLSHTQAGSIFLVAACGNFIGSMGAGFLSSKINHKGTLVCSTFFVGVMLWAFMFVSSLGTIRIGIFFLSLASGLNLPSNVATITAMVRRQDWGKALGVQQLGPPFSLVMGPIFVVIFLSWFDWRMPLAVLGSIAIVAALAFAKFGRCGDFAGDPPSLSLIKSLLGYKSFWVMVVLFALGMGGQVGVYAMLPLYLVTEHGLSGDTANTILGLSQVSCLVLTFFAGWLTDRLGEQKMILMVLSVAGLATILMGVLSGPWLKFLVFLQPALIVCFFPAGFAALSRSVQPNMRGLASALVPPTAFIIGGGLLPVILGYMGQTYSFGLGIALFGILIFLGAGLVFALTLLDKMDPGC